MENSIYIELGGSYLRLYSKQDSFILREPSLIAGSNIEGKLHIKAFGKEAKKLAEIGDENIIVFSPFSEGRIKNFEYAHLFIQHVLKTASIKKRLFRKLNAVILTCIGIKENEKNEISRLFTLLGFNQIDFVYSVICVNSYLGFNTYVQRPNLIVDIGGSKTDVGLVLNDAVLTGATVNLGGKGMNKSVLDYVSSKYDIELPLVLAEKLKEELASLYDNDISSMKIRAVDNGTNNEIVSIVYANDIKEAILPYFEEIIKLIETTLNMCNDEILSSIKKNGIYLCGGVAKTTGLDNFLKEKLQIMINIVDNIDNASILGACKLK